MLWKIYFWIYTVLTVLGFLFLLPQLPIFNLMDYEGIIEGIFIILGLYSYIYKKKFLSKNNWRAIFYFIAIIWVIQLIAYANAIPLLTPYISIFKLNTISTYNEVIFGVFFSLPALYVIYKLSQEK